MQHPNMYGWLHATVQAPSSLAFFSLTPSSRAVLFLIARLGMRAASRTAEGKRLSAIRFPLSVFPLHVASSRSTYTRTTTPLVSHMVPSHQLAYSPHWRRPRSELSGPVSRSTFNVCAHGSSFPSEDPADVQMPAFANLALLRSRHHISVFVLPLSAAGGLAHVLSHCNRPS